MDDGWSFAAGLSDACLRAAGRSASVRRTIDALPADRSPKSRRQLPPRPGIVPWKQHGKRSTGSPNRRYSSAVHERSVAAAISTLFRVVKPLPLKPAASTRADRRQGQRASAIHA